METTLTEIKKENPCYVVLYKNSGEFRIVDEWSEVAPLKKGHGDATHKKFGSRRLAEQWVNGEKPVIQYINKDMPTFYTDGSFNKDENAYGWSFACLLGGKVIESARGMGNEPGVVEQRNVAGEMIGVMKALQYAIAKGMKEIEIRYDYAGLGKWVTGAFKTDSVPSEKYANWVRAMGDKYGVTIHFLQMPGHTGEYYNELADILARKGCGVAITNAEEQVLADVGTM